MSNSIGPFVVKPTETRHLLLIGLLALWLIAFVYAFVAFATSDPTGDGFTRGLNRVGRFLGWQGIAGLIALAAFGVSRAWPKGAAIRKIAQIPFMIALLQVTGLVAVLLWARFGVG